MERTRLARRSLWVLAFVVAGGAAARAGNPPGSETEAYVAAAAHAPRFAEKTLWPHYTGKEEYAQQQWPKARVLVWSGGSGRFTDASKWLEAGRPAKRAPDRRTDVVFPPGKGRYSVNAGNAACRHITVGRSAAVHGGKKQLAVHGNCWVKLGGDLQEPNVTGDKSTFFRMDVPPDSVRPPHYDKPPGFPHTIHDKMSVAKFHGASVEFLGTLGTRDEIYIAIGRMIIGPDSQFRTNVATGNGTMEVFDGATLELQSGAQVVNHRRTALCNFAFHTGATLQAGSPKRPLTRDAYLRPDPFVFKREPRIFFEKGSAVRVFSVDPAKARLVIESNVPGVKLPGGRGLELSLAGKAELNGVVFDQFLASGIRLANPSARKGWQNVFFGPNNAGGERELFASAKIDKLGARWNTRGIKYRQLVRPRLAEMKQFGEEDAAPGPGGDE